MIRNPAHLGLRYTVSSQELSNDTTNNIVVNYDNLTDFYRFATGVTPTSTVTINAQIDLSSVQNGLQKRVIVANNTATNGDSVVFNVTAINGTAVIYNSKKSYFSFNSNEALYFDIELMGDASNSIIISWGVGQETNQGVVTEITSTNDSVSLASTGTGDVIEITSSDTSFYVTSFGIGDITSIASTDKTLIVT